MLWVVPLCVAMFLSLSLLAPQASRRADLFVSRLALSVFGDYVADESPRKQKQQEKMRATHAGGTHRVYASRTLLYCAVLGVVGSIVGVYIAAGFLAVMKISGDAMEQVLPSALSFLVDLTRIWALDAFELFGLLIFFSATVGSLLAFGTYYARWELLSQRAVVRATKIEATLPRTIAFVYALSRSGIAFPKIMDTLAANEQVYGEAATELSVAVRDMNTFGTDVLTALQRTAQRTPSDNMEEFSENLASVLGSGRSLGEFLHDQYERYQEEAESQQEQYIELLSTFAEVYVTALVAGPLFLITTLVVIGLVTEDMLPILRAFVYVVVPLVSVGFIAYVDKIMQSFQSPGEGGIGWSDENAGEFTLPDGGTFGEEWQVSRERLVEYERFQRVRDWIERPMQLIVRNPGLTAVVTGPIVLAWVYATADPLPGITDPVGILTAIDDPIVEGSIFALSVYAIVYETRKRRTRSIEAAVPDFLDRLASINDAGMSVVESVRRVTDSDLDELTPELERTWRDVQWGADVESALKRLEMRIESPAISRTVALITNAMQVSGEIAPVVTIAADEMRASRRLRHERKQMMVTYLIVIYISFLVFLGIIAALTVSFFPAIEDAEVARESAEMAAGVSNSLTEGLGDIDVDAYEVVFFHAAIVQAACSGLVAGQMGEGQIRDGVKHSVALLALTYVSFAIMGIL